MRAVGAMAEVVEKTGARRVAPVGAAPVERHQIGAAHRAPDAPVQGPDGPDLGAPTNGAGPAVIAMARRPGADRRTQVSAVSRLRGARPFGSS